VKKTASLIILLAITIMVTSCAGIINIRHPKAERGTGSAKAKKNMPPVMFEDFEKGALTGGYSYANTQGGASVTYATGAENAHKGSYCAKATFDSGTDSDWGCGFGSGTSYGQGYIDAADRSAISMWVKAPEGVTFYVFVNEAGANGADGEFWNSPDQTGSGQWMEYIIPFDALFRNIYSGNQAGNLEFDSEGIGTVGGQIGGAQGTGVLLIDDIWFK